MSAKLGFSREEIAGRYDIRELVEDKWHEHSTIEYYAFLREVMQDIKPRLTPYLALNAGCGVYSLFMDGWDEVGIDIFLKPLLGKPSRVCGNIEGLPFASESFDGVACVGEVLAYCKPSLALKEMARVLKPGGPLVFDFGSTRSARFWMTSHYGRAADIVTVPYNGRPERTWVYDPEYMMSLVEECGCDVVEVRGIHSFSCLARKVGISVTNSIYVERALSKLIRLTGFSDTIMVWAKKR